MCHVTTAHCVLLWVDVHYLNHFDNQHESLW